MGKSQAAVGQAFRVGANSRSPLIGLFVAIPSSMLGFVLLRVLVITRLQDWGLVEVAPDRLLLLHVLTLMVPLAILTTYYSLQRDRRRAWGRFAAVFAAEWLLLSGYLGFAYLFLGDSRHFWLPGLGGVQRERAGYLVAATVSSLLLAGMFAFLAVRSSTRQKEASA